MLTHHVNCFASLKLGPEFPLTYGLDCFVTSGVGTAYPFGAPAFIPVFVTRSLVLCVWFLDRYLSFCPFSLGHCVLCPVSIY